MTTMRRLSGLSTPLRAALLAGVVLVLPAPARAWGDDGHRIIALIAEKHLAPPVKATLDALLRSDPDTLTAPDLASRATWADRYRESDRGGTQVRYRLTRSWHFVDLELDRPDLAEACHGHPPAADPASAGPANSCIVDRLSAFMAELRSRPADDPEKLIALRFVLHLAGDIHQPLHTADNHDRGGNDVRVQAGPTANPQTLHSYWDVNVVTVQGGDPASVAAALDARFAGRCQGWMAGGPADWAMDSFAVGRDVAYRLGRRPEGQGPVMLDPDYQARAAAAAAEQLAKAGCRLAMVLNQALP
jgi:hypothetical protein